MRNARCVSTPDSEKRKQAKLKWLACLLFLLGAALPASSQCAGLGNNKLAISTSGAFTVGGAHPSYTMSISGASVNGLGLSNTSGWTGTSVATGFWYTGSVVLTGCSYNAGATTATVTAFASSNTQFAACAAGCTGTTLGTSAPGTTVLASLKAGNANQQTISVGLFVSNQSGTGFSTTGATSITISFVLLTSAGRGETVTLAISFTNETALTLALSSNGGITVGASAGFGNVNGLGVGSPLAGLTIQTPTCGTPCAINPGVIYSTPYFITPTFSSFTSATGTVDVQVTSDFARPAVLQLMDASSASGGTFPSFNAIGRSSLGQAATQITNAASSTTAISRFLGLEVMHVNGQGSGADSATLTYTLTVP